MNKSLGDKVKTWLREPLPIHRHSPKPEACLTPLAQAELEQKHTVTLRYIQQLESRLAQAERERDAAVADLKEATESGSVCTGCKHDTDFDRPCEQADFDCKQCIQPCKCKTCERNSNYEWRGPCPENTKEEPK